MNSLKLRLITIASIFFVVGLVADLLPHPALGPGLIQSCLNAIFPD